MKNTAGRKNHDFGFGALRGMKGGENVANFLGGRGAKRLDVCLEPNGNVKPCVFFETNKETIRGNVLRESYEEVWDRDEFFWKLRTQKPQVIQSGWVQGRLWKL